MGRQWQMPKVTFSEAYVSLLKIYIYKANYIYYCNPSYFQISTNALNTNTHTQTRARTMILVRPLPLRIAAIQEPQIITLIYVAEVVDACAAIPSLQMGESTPNIATDMDIISYKLPLGVTASICPFNFPAMIPLWSFPVSVACGNATILKPSERVPGASMILADLFTRAGAPPGLLNVIHGQHAAVDFICEHPDIKAVSFVGSDQAVRVSCFFCSFFLFFLFYLLSQGGENRLICSMVKRLCIRGYVEGKVEIANEQNIDAPESHGVLTVAYPCEMLSLLLKRFMRKLSRISDVVQGSNSSVSSLQGIVS